MVMEGIKSGFVELVRFMGVHQKPKKGEFRK